MEQIPNSVEDTVSKLKTVGQNYKKIFSVIGIIILIIGIFYGCDSKSNSDYNTHDDYQNYDFEDDVTINEKSNSDVQNYEIIDITADCNFGSAYDSQYSKIAIKAPKLEGLDYDSNLNISENNGYCVLRYQSKSDDNSDFNTFYKGTEEDVQANNGELIGFLIYQEGKYQMVDGEAIDNDDIYALVDADGKTIIYWTRNSNLDENYYDSNGNLIYQQLFLNGSDHVTCFDLNGYEISLKDFYNSIISDYVNEQVVSYYFNDKLSKME